MSQRVSAADAFVPLDPASATEGKASTASAGLKVVAKSASDLDFTPLQVPGVPHVHATGGRGGKPVVTLERDGERVTGVRIECPCGQVIELACSY
jgi:hypothetical protein